MDQLGFGFEADEQAKKKREAIEQHKHLWRICWDWDGPEVGGYCEVHNITAQLETPAEDGRTSIYAYMERCRILEQLDDDHWLCVIDMGIVHGKPWPDDGTRVILDTLNIWPSTRDLRGMN